MAHFGDLVVRRDFLAILTDLEPELAKRAHVDVGDEHERKKRDDVATQIVQPQVITRENEERERDVVAETVLAGEEVKELALHDRLAGSAPADTVVARLPKDLLVRDRPRHASNRDGENEEHADLHAETHF